MNLASVSVPVVVAAALAGCASVDGEASTSSWTTREARMRLVSERRGARTDEHGRVRNETRSVYGQWW